MGPTMPNKGGRPKKSKSFRGSTPKQETIPKCSIDTKNINSEKLCIQKSTQGMSSSIVKNSNALNDANVRIPFLPVNEIWQRQMCEFFKIELRNVPGCISSNCWNTIINENN